MINQNSKTRGIGASNEYVFVATREGTDGKKIVVYDATDGDSIGVLNTTNITGGNFPLNDVGVTNDGKIITANLANPATSSVTFKIYMYDNLTDAPTVIYTEDVTNYRRTGDLFTVVGDYSKGTAKIYTASAISAGTLLVSDIYVLEMESGQWKTTRTKINSISFLTGSTTIVAPGVAVKPNGDIFWKASARNLYRVTPTSVEGETTMFLSQANSIKYIGHDPTYNLDYFAVFAYDGSKGYECTLILSMTPGNIDSRKIIGQTPSLGTNANVGGTGDVEVRFDETGNPIIYVLSTTNGFGAYKVTGLVTELPKLPVNKAIKIYPNPAKETVNFSERAKKVKLFSISGQLLNESYNIDRLNVEGLKGIYLLEIETEKGTKAYERLMVE